MIWPATWLAGAVGFALASVPGALLGGVLGYLLDRRLSLHSWAQLLGRQSSLGNDRLRFLLLGRLAKCNGRVRPAHIEQARDEMRRLGLDEPSRRLAEDAFRQGKDTDDELLPLRQALERLRQQRAEAQSLLLSCWRLVEATGGASTQERQLIMRWGQWLGWSAEELKALTIGLGPKRGCADQEYRAALSLLGVTDKSDPAAIKRAYRRLLSQHHPDKQVAASAEQVRLATEQTRNLHHAYALLRERHRLR